MPVKGSMINRTLTAGAKLFLLDEHMYDMDVLIESEIQNIGPPRDKIVLVQGDMTEKPMSSSTFYYSRYFDVPSLFEAQGW